MSDSIPHRAKYPYFKVPFFDVFSHWVVHISASEPLNLCSSGYASPVHRFSAEWAELMLKNLLKRLMAAENPVILPVPYCAMFMHIYPDVYLFLLLMRPVFRGWWDCVIAWCELA